MKRTERTILGVLLALGMILGMTLMVQAREITGTVTFSTNVGQNVASVGIEKGDILKNDSKIKSDSNSISRTVDGIGYAGVVTQVEIDAVHFSSTITGGASWTATHDYVVTEIKFLGNGTFNAGSKGTKYLYKYALSVAPVIGGKTQWNIGETIEFGKTGNYIYNHMFKDEYTSSLPSSSYVIKDIYWYQDHYVVLLSDNWSFMVYKQEESEPPSGIKLVKGIGISDNPYLFDVICDHTHSAAAEWSSNESDHWHVCTKCGVKVDEAPHSYGTSGDARFTCTVCKYVDTGLKAKAEEADKAAAETSAPGQVPTVKTADDTAAPGQVPTVKTESDPITINKVPAGVKAKAKKDKVTITWKKIKKTKKTKKLLKQIKGIQVQVAKDPAFTEIAADRKVGKKKTKVVLKMKKKTTYYVRVRYVGKDGYSNWSKVKCVKTK